MLVGVQIGDLRLAHEAAENHRELGKPLNIIDAGNLFGLRLGVLVSLPDFQVFVRFAQEQDFAVFLLSSFRENQQNALLLLDAGEEK